MLPVVIEESAGQTPLQSNGTDQFGSGLAGAVELNRSEAASKLTAEPSQLDGDSAWGLLCPVPEFSPADLQELVSALDQHAEMASISLVAAITRAKLTLRGISPWTAPDAPLQIGAGDLVVLLRSALRGVR